MRIYFLGIGGVSMSALALLMKHEGHEVSGSDEVSGRGVEILNEHGVDVDFCVNKKAIAQSDMIVASSAIKSTDPRMIYAKKCGKKVFSRGQLLGQISEGYEKVIAVAGSHGKTTTTALIFEILRTAGKNPTLHLGGYRNEDDLNFCVGEHEFFVTEACEYCDNFLYLHPHISVITNIEKEHMDYFKTFSREVASFEKFKSQSRYVIDDFCGLQAKNVCHDKHGFLQFTLCRGDFSMRLQTKLCEEVNTQNVMQAFLVAKKLGISEEIFKLAVERFEGVKCRFERVKSPFFDICICDYAHHPTEIEKSISTMKKVFKDKNLVVIFQPHTYSRTKTLLKEFLNVFEDVPTVGIFKTYSARETEKDGISGEKLCQIMQESGKNAFYFEKFQNLRQFLSNFSKTETALLFAGAGDLPSIAQKEGLFE